MKRMKIAAILMTVLMLAALPALTLAEGTFGSAAVNAATTYTLDEMLTYAMQDEYMAQAEYTAILNAYGNDAPFANILRAEGTHIALLTTLFETHGVTVPANDAASRVTLPASLDEAYAAGVTAENANIAMYGVFLAQNDLPEDVRAAFLSLQNASKSHLNAFTRNAGNGGMGGRFGAGGNSGRWNNGNGTNGNWNQNSTTCPMYNGTANGTVGCGRNWNNGNQNNGNWNQNGTTCPLYDGTANGCVGCGRNVSNGI